MKDICMIAHRGFSGKYFQNTEIAFRKAAENASGGAETDIRMTKDGVLVCSHNREAVFEDGTELIVSDSTFAELTAKPLRNNLTDDKVYLCTFRRYLEVMRDNNMICFVELKDEFTDEQIVEVFGMVSEVYDLSKCILQSFDFDNLVRTHRLCPELGIMLTYGKNERNYERCFEYGFSLDSDLSITTQQMVDEFQKRNLLAAVWTVNDREGLERARAMGVDFIESDVFGGND